MWAMVFQQSGKLRFHDARSEMVKCVKRLPAVLSTIELWSHEVKAVGLQEHVHGDTVRAPEAAVAF